MRLPFLTAVALAVLPSALALAAFPGAQGFGASTTGGRGGSVYIVTNLNDTGSGSLRDAVSQSNRIIVFAVGGIINITSRLVIQKNISILGQTAPGQGITVYGNGVSYSSGSNTITRYIRFRMGKSGDSGKDAITIAEGSNMIFDHVSISWGRDETFSINGDVSNVTIQDCIIAQGLETHSCGGLIQTDGGVSIIRTLYIDNKTRNPKVKGKNEFVNNVVYNWGGGGGYIAGDSDGQSYANIINNMFISGPSTTITAFTRGNANFHTFVSGNYYDPDKDGTLNGHVLAATTDNYSDVDFQAAAYAYPTVSGLMNATAALDYVKAHAGASKSRDHVDTYLISTELGSLGKVGATISDPTVSPMNGPGPITGGTVHAVVMTSRSMLTVMMRQAPTDTDNDGIPDAWEKANGLNANDASDAVKIASNGYANIENYANSLV
ncbi:polysaccharide lyase family 1 protein [Exidia glandulosa HHB12029]|uniref:Polysaccharide lyase family 1 protein n=1 Tax=Exidia glandulosa HHB12029 TaxID=1314781 RepID=A0A165KP22_EXIGL|nr:polysaccharide lyase family 1 protein [Exidia glandulosa HHB12029]